VLNLWTVVLVTNLIGGLLFGLIVAKSSLFEADLHQSFGELASEALGHPFGTTLLRAIFAGWLIALMVWLLPAAETARVWIIVILTYLVGVFHFPHIIAGASEVFYLAFTGARGWGEIFGGFIVPALIGNTIGG